MEIKKGILSFMAKLDGRKTTKKVAEYVPSVARAFGFGAKDRKLPKIEPKDAYNIDTVWACWNVLSQDISSLPLYLMRRNGVHREIVRDHPVAHLLESPNAIMTGQEWRANMMVRLLAYGNAYDQVLRDDNGVSEIYPLNNDKLSLAIEKGELYYLYKTDKVKGGVAALSASDVLHVKGLSTDGVVGLSPIAAHKKALGLAVQAEDFGLEFFGNGAVMSGVAQFESELSNESWERLKKSFNDTYTGSGNRNKVLILEEGAKFTPISVPANQAQFLETRKYQRSVICGIYRVPAHMVNDLERATFSNIEEQGIMYVSNTLLPWCVAIEKRLAKTLLTEEERQSGYYFKHNLRGLMRGKFSEQMASFATARQNGFMNANEVRELLDLNPYEGGDEYLVNTALGSAQTKEAGNGMVQH